MSFCDKNGFALLAGVACRPVLLVGILRLAAAAPRARCLTGLDSRFEIFAAAPEAIGSPVHRGVCHVA